MPAVCPPRGGGQTPGRERPEFLPGLPGNAQPVRYDEGAGLDTSEVEDMRGGGGGFGGRGIAFGGGGLGLVGVVIYVLVQVLGGGSGGTPGTTGATGFG